MALVIDAIHTTVSSAIGASDPTSVQEALS